MKQIKETKKTKTIVLEDGDVLNICKMGQLKHIVRIVCNSQTLHFDDITYAELMNIKEEKKATHQMKKYIKKQDI